MTTGCDAKSLSAEQIPKNYFAEKNQSNHNVQLCI